MTNLNELTITQAQEGLKKKEFSSVDLTNACLSAIEKAEPSINALVTITKDEARKAAKKADTMLQNGDDLPLLGIPTIIKDNFSTKGIKTTASSLVLDTYIPPYNATVVEKLEAAGMVMLGKANMDAWAHGSSTETSDYGPSKNPWNTKHLPGGSSGGTAAGVAAQEAVYGIGSETAGSIRQPAAWCGIVGLKPTYGRVSRYGVIAMASSLDCPGPITKTVEDSALVLQAIAGHDPLDATSSPRAVPNYVKHMKDGVQGMTIGISDQYFVDGMNEEVKISVEAAIKELEKLGATIKKLTLFDPKNAVAVYTILQRSEVSSNLARFDGIRYGLARQNFGTEAKRRIMLGTYTLSAGYYDAYYKKAQQVRTLMVQDFNKAFEQVDIIVSPTSPSLAAKLGASNDNPMFGEIADMLVEPSSIAGLPGISVPCGYGKNGLPIGMQIMGKQFDEATIIKSAYAYEQATNWHTKKPIL